ncbi:HI1450 family dsDNA-mimic protein [Vibrio sp. RC27]
MSQLLSYDDVIDTAYDIFLEMAPDNLEQPQLGQFEQDFDQQGAAIAIELGNDWESHVGFNIDENNYAEIHIGLVDESQQKLGVIFARILISRIDDEKFCHILWQRDSSN